MADTAQRASREGSLDAALDAVGAHLETHIDLDRLLTLAR